MKVTLKPRRLGFQLFVRWKNGSLRKLIILFIVLKLIFIFFTLDQSKLEKSPVWFAREIIGAPTQKEDAFQTYDLFEGEVFQQRLNVESSDSFLDVLYDGLRYFEQLKKDEIASTWRIRLDLDNVGNLQKSLVFPQLYLEVFKK